MSDVGDAAADDAGVAPETLAALDVAGEASRRAPADRDAQEKLWRAVLGLDRWFFLARGSDDQPTPFATNTDDGAVLFAFSTEERAHAAGVEFGMTEEEARRMLVVPLPGAAVWVAAFAESGVDALVFDAPINGAMTPLTNLAAMAVWISEHP